MNKLNLFGIMLLFVAMFVSCNEKEENSSEIQVKNKEALNQTLYADQTQSESITFSTTGVWTSSIKPSEAESWISISPKNGSNGNHNISMNLDINTSGNDRSAVITITCKGEEIAINITQKAKTKDEKTPSNFQVENEKTLNQTIYADQTQGESVTFTTLDAWTSSITPNESSWISISPDKGSNVGNYSVNLKFDTNTSGSDRTAVITISCKREDIVINVKQKATKEDGKPYIVYVVGYERNAQNITVAKLWKNGVAQNLSNGSTHAGAYSVYVSGNDVYVAGYESNAQSLVAKLWKNGVAQNLTNGSTEAVAKSVFVSDNNVYVAGYEKDSRNLSVARLWKNGVVQDLSDGNAPTYANSVYAAGSNVYVVGSGGYGYNYPAKLWKNGAAQNLTDGGVGAEAESVFVTDGDVYVALNERLGPGVNFIGNGVPILNYVAMVRKNDELKKLTTGNNYAVANSVYVFGSDVYVAGYENINGIDNARLWKNGATQSITNGTYATAFSVYVLGSDVYVAGSEYIGGGIDVARLWKNGRSQDLTNRIYSGRAYCVFVQ